MIQGIGTDIVKIDRIHSAIAGTPSFKGRIYTPAEISYCEQHLIPWTHFAVRFAAKEAVAKSLGTGFRGFGFLDIEIMKDGMGKPTAMAGLKLLSIMKKRNVSKFELSLSFDHEYAIAFAIALSD